MQGQMETELGKIVIDTDILIDEVLMFISMI